MILPLQAPLPLTVQYNINLPPLPNDNRCLAFVVLRLTTYPKHSKQVNQPGEMKVTLPTELREQLEEVFATQAQQFKGYLFQSYEGAHQEVGGL